MSDSMVLKDDHPVDPDDELLVAYLDGELTDGERELVEKRLVKEIGFRTRLQSLQTGWEWLDDLPDETPDEKLVESTIELVIADIAPPEPKQTSWLSRHRRALAIGGVCFLCLIVGSLGAVAARRAAMRSELEDLAVAEHYDAYLIGQDFDFIRELDINANWRAMLDATEVSGQIMAPPTLLADVPATDRADFIRDLPLEDRSRLESRWNRFQNLRPQQQDEVRRTAESVAVQPDSERLLKTMKTLAVWRETLDDEQKDGLRSDDKSVRDEALESGITKTMDSLVRRSGSFISDETADIIYLRLHQLLQQRIDESQEIAAMRDRIRANIQSVMFAHSQADEAATWVLMQMMVQPEAMRGGRGGQPGFGGPGGGRFRGMFGGRGRGDGPRPEGQRPDGQRGDGPRPEGQRPGDPRGLPVPPITDSELLDLTLLIDDDALADLEALTNFPAQFQRDEATIVILRAWAIETLFRKAPVPTGDKRSTLDKYLEMIELEGGDDVDLLPPKEILDRLSDPPQWFDRFRRPAPRGGNR